MRRSAAPSQVGLPLKRAKFVPPPSKYSDFGTLYSSETYVDKRGVSEAKDESVQKVSGVNCTQLAPVSISGRLGKDNAGISSRSITDTVARDVTAIALLTRGNVNNLKNCQAVGCVTSQQIETLNSDTALNMDSTRVSETHKQECVKKSNPLVPFNNSESGSTFGPLSENSNVMPEKNSATRYLSVMWCKMSKKKHKKWEGDAVLATHGRSATLYDMEGKVIGKGAGYKTTELASLKEDESLFVGGKEIQVMSLLSEDQFKSGKCFSVTGGSTDSTPSSCKAGLSNSKSSSKPFTNPLLKSSKHTMKGVESISFGPKYDPTVPGALVMPRPGPDHQWRNNKQGVATVDVVLDPYLSTSLRPHQREGVIFLYECITGLRDYQGQGAILADDMGLGKTLQCISLIWTLLKQGPYGGKPILKKVLIITPGSLVKNWFMEFKKWLGSERLNVYAVSGDKRAEDYVKSNLSPVLVISYEMFVRCYETLKQVQFDLIVCDEGHRLKNSAIKTTSLIMGLPSKKRIVLTGTPVQNDLQEFYSIVEFCNPGILGSSAAFKRVYEDPIVMSRQPKASSAQKELGTERAQELTRLTQMFVLRRTQEINNDYLPPKVELVLFCRPSSLQLCLYRQLVRSNLVRQCLAGDLAGSPHLVCIGALKQLCNHPGLVYRKAKEEQIRREERKHGAGFDDLGLEHDKENNSLYNGLLSHFPDSFNANIVSLEESGKLQVLSQILASIWQLPSKEKVVLVSNHTKTLDFLQVFCDNQGYSSLRLDGQTPTGQRQNIVTQFNSKHNPHRVFLLSSKAGGVGLNLVGASRLILYDIDWNPANDLQAMARVWRDGQTRKVHIYRLLTTGTIEEKVYQRQIAKQGLSGAIMDLGNKNNVQFSLEDLKDLFTLNEKTDCETHSMLACDCQGDPSHDHRLQAPTVTSEDRPCQLGKTLHTGEKKASNLTMAELLRWKHWQSHFRGEHKDWCLQETGSALSFIFWHEINTT